MYRHVHKITVKKIHIHVYDCVPIYKYICMYTHMYVHIYLSTNLYISPPIIHAHAPISTHTSTHSPRIQTDIYLYIKVKCCICEIPWPFMRVALSEAGEEM